MKQIHSEVHLATQCVMKLTKPPTAVARGGRVEKQTRDNKNAAASSSDWSVESATISSNTSHPSPFREWILRCFPLSSPPVGKNTFGTEDSEANDDTEIALLLQGLAELPDATPAAPLLCASPSCLIGPLPAAHDIDALRSVSRMAASFSCSTAAPLVVPIPWSCDASTSKSNCWSSDTAARVSSLICMFAEEQAAADARSVPGAALRVLQAGITVQCHLWGIIHCTNAESDDDDDSASVGGVPPPALLVQSDLRNASCWVLRAPPVPPHCILGSPYATGKLLRMLLPSWATVDTALKQLGHKDSLATLLPQSSAYIAGLRSTHRWLTEMTVSVTGLSTSASSSSFSNIEAELRLICPGDVLYSWMVMVVTGLCLHAAHEHSISSKAESERVPLPFKPASTASTLSISSSRIFCDTMTIVARIGNLVLEDLRCRRDDSTCWETVRDGVEEITKLAASSMSSAAFKPLATVHTEMQRWFSVLSTTLLQWANASVALCAASDATAHSHPSALPAQRQRLMVFIFPCNAPPSSSSSCGVASSVVRLHNFAADAVYLMMQHDSSSPQGRRFVASPNAAGASIHRHMSQWGKSTVMKESLLLFETPEEAEEREGTDGRRRVLPDSVDAAAAANRLLVTDQHVCGMVAAYAVMRAPWITDTATRGSERDRQSQMSFSNGSSGSTTGAAGSAATPVDLLSCFDSQVLVNRLSTSHSTAGEPVAAGARSDTKKSRRESSRAHDAVTPKRNDFDADDRLRPTVTLTKKVAAGPNHIETMAHVADPARAVRQQLLQREWLALESSTIRSVLSILDILVESASVTSASERASTSNMKLLQCWCLISSSFSSYSYSSLSPWLRLPGSLLFQTCEQLQTSPSTSATFQVDAHHHSESEWEIIHADDFCSKYAAFVAGSPTMTALTMQHNRIPDDVFLRALIDALEFPSEAARVMLRESDATATTTTGSDDSCYIVLVKVGEGSAHLARLDRAIAEFGAQQSSIPSGTIRAKQKQSPTRSTDLNRHASRPNSSIRPAAVVSSSGRRSSASASWTELRCTPNKRFVDSKTIQQLQQLERKYEQGVPLSRDESDAFRWHVSSAEVVAAAQREAEQEHLERMKQDPKLPPWRKATLTPLHQSVRLVQRRHPTQQQASLTRSSDVRRHSDATLGVSATASTALHPNATAQRTAPPVFSTEAAFTTNEMRKMVAAVLQ